MIQIIFCSIFRFPHFCWLYAIILCICLQGLDSLTAINLERNLIQNIASDAFAGVADTLSSLSLLNNLLTDFPTPAISTLKELRVSAVICICINMLSH